MTGHLSYPIFTMGLFAWLSLSSLVVDAFVSPSRSSSPKLLQVQSLVVGGSRLLQVSSPSALFQSESSSEDIPKRRKKRVKRKQQEDEGDGEEDDSATPAVSVDFRPREDTAVSLQVQDIRDLVGGRRKTTPTAESTRTTTTTSDAKPSTSISAPTGDMEDALQMMLKDAQEMQSLERNNNSEGESGEESDLSIPDVLRKVISTVVTVDFFVVCGFLLWFLAGIFCSYVIKDDTVQIAFNQLFQPVVQPALGILMIGAVAGSFFEKEEKEGQI